MSDVPENHPRYESLRIRDAIVEGVRRGVTSEHGLIAHGRGEAFDYLLGERTRDFALVAIEAAAALLIAARHPVISVNGNAAALVPEGLVALGEALGAPLEVNIFHASKQRETAIREHLEAHGAREVLMPTTEARLDFIESNRRFVHPEGIFKADAVFVPLEDGDRCQALVRMRKSVVTVDLNPMSRTSRTATVTIVDNVVRAMPLLIERVRAGPGRAGRETRAYDNAAGLRAAEAAIRNPG
ncbi:MAG: 4-phosphopantoate--beta-alanine ligase [Gammaproteobacteria bacterium]|nr:4-phosphopantoate--beta-alanine ligase [Gammaproteobacteria bacterium]